MARAIAAAALLRADPEKEVFLGLEANEQRVKTLDLSHHRVVAFATHGLVPGDLEGLGEPGLALSNPELAGARALLVSNRPVETVSARLLPLFWAPFSLVGDGN
ncbi:MAG: hypothetical protein EPO20_05290 [Betaproteobacteria bacterium]|nr:MAG: hypothetical protein EPO20_05290 [Betaproteobacteria bacterium]